MKYTIHYLLIIAFSFSVLHSYADTFDSDGVEIFYTDQGDGEPVVLIHGLLGSAESNFGEVGITKALAVDHRVISFDNRGHGVSGKPHNPEAYGEKMVLDVINLMDHLGIEKANMVGYSLGGTITQKLIALYPERVIKAISAGSGWTGKRGGTMRSINEKLATSLESGNGIAPLIKLLTPAGHPLPTPEQMAEQNQMAMAANDPLALVAVLRSGSDLFVTEAELRANTVPLLYIVGDLDPLKNDVDQAIPLVSNVQLVVIPDASHFSAFWHPVFLQSIQAFLSDKTSGKRN